MVVYNDLLFMVTCFPLEIIYSIVVHIDWIMWIFYLNLFILGDLCLIFMGNNKKV